MPLFCFFADPFTMPRSCIRHLRISQQYGILYPWKTDRQASGSDPVRRDRIITVNIYYTGRSGSARAFAEEMVASGVVSDIRAEDGSIRYEYFFPMDDPETVLLIDQWRDQAAIDAHHASPMMAGIAALREKYDLHMKVERFDSSGNGIPEKDREFIR